MNMKICFTSSSGGHFEQLMALKPLMNKYNSFVVTERTKYSNDIGIRGYSVMQVNRKSFSFPFIFFLNTLKSVAILVKEKPDAIVCTGVLATIPICILGKIMGSKIIYIESYAKVSSPTQTGKLIYKFADRFYVQWKSMLKIYPKARYVGGIY